MPVCNARLLWTETMPPLAAAGFLLERWKTYGFLGGCSFMNRDASVFNSYFRFIPGIRAITRLATRLPGLQRAGLSVVGRAVKP